MYSAPQLAEKIGTDSKTLRHFLRQNDSFRNPGSGGRYSFTESEARSVEKAFNAWRRARRSQTSGDTSARGKTQKSAAGGKKRAQERVDSLEASLLASGKHISQIEAR